MTTGDELVALLRQVRRTNEPGFDIVDIPSARGFKIGRDERNAVILLTPPDCNAQPPTNLRRIALDPRTRLAIRFSNGAEETGEFGLIQLKLGESEYLGAFLHVVANLIRVIGPSPGPGEVSIAMRRLVRLFDASPDARGSVLGLWGELLVLCSASDAECMLDSWHAALDAKFDFSTNGSRLEVKTTTSLERKHIFSLEQVEPVLGTWVAVASIMTTETQSGTSVQSLVRRAEELFAGDARRQMRIHEIVAETLGEEWARFVDRKFDEDQARTSLLVFAAGAIPRAVADSPDVSGVSFTANCSNVLPESDPHGLAGLLPTR